MTATSAPAAGTAGTAAAAALRALRGARASWQAWWETTSAANRARVQLATFLVLVVVAFHYSLRTLIGNLDLSTPLAYVGLVPVIALGLGAARSRPRPGELAVHDRQLDYIVGLPLIAAAVTIDLVLPRHLAAMFWVWRMDLFSLPFFAAGSVALIFGTRAMLRQKFTLAYLLLAWPLPYTLVLLQVLNGFTSVTLDTLHHLLRVLPVATALPSSDGSLFQVVHAGTPFPLSVVSACSGVDSVVGFLLVGSAFAALVAGPRLRKTLWLASGMALLWALNIGRIVFIFWAGRTWGEHVAISILHPFIGLVTFSLGVVAMMLVMPLLGLSIDLGERPAAPAADAAGLPVRHLLPATALLLVVSVVLGTADTALRSYDLVADSTGEAKLASYSADPAAPAGWQANYETAYTWATPYFGEDSTWLRYLYTRSGQAGDLNASLPVTADVIDTTNLSSFSAYGVQACYNFHGYTMRDVATVHLTGRIQGQALSYATGTDGTWTIVYWIMPVKPAATAKAGGGTHYERVILYLQDTPATKVSYTGTDPALISNLSGSLGGGTPEDRRLLADRAFLVRFADEVITNQAKVQAGAAVGQGVLAASPTGGASTGSVTPAALAGLSAPEAAVSLSPSAPAWAAAAFARLTPAARIVYERAHPTWFAGA
ncbi:MAG TPA: exosortase/archaeosortase family protein [Acidimicrobiales bacterium]|nr:exosortase/archaeosortase family protein [Acidimicrobiales bacterium]